MGKPSKLRRKLRRRAEWQAYLQTMRDKRIIIPCNQGRRCTNEAVAYGGWRRWCEEHSPFTTSGECGVEHEEHLMFDPLTSAR